MPTYRTPHLSGSPAWQPAHGRRGGDEGPRLREVREAQALEEVERHARIHVERVVRRAVGLPVEPTGREKGSTMDVSPSVCNISSVHLNVPRTFL